MNARSERVEFWCSDRATSSLPVPLSPLIRIVVRLGAAWMIRSNTCSHPRAPADDVPELVLVRLQVLPQRAVLGHQAPLRERVAEDDQHFVVLERLGDVVEGAALHRRDRVLHRRERGDHQHRQVVVDLLQLVERGDPVHPRHHHVDDRRVERHRAREVEPLPRAGSKADVVPLAGEQRVENLAHDLLVVDDQDGSLTNHKNADF